MKFTHWQGQHVRAAMIDDKQRPNGGSGVHLASKIDHF
jgi:hypothetical protein